MLRVSIYSGSLEQKSVLTRRAWLDIGYEKLDVIADYKTVLIQAGVGESRQAPIYRYPRWSASLWDLVSRGLALGLRPQEEEALACLTPEVPPVILKRKRSAFVDKLAVVIELHDTNSANHPKEVAWAEIKQKGRARGTYIATFKEEWMKQATTDPFNFEPDMLRPAELVLHACLVHLNKKLEFCEMPRPLVPEKFEWDGKEHIEIEKLPEPARSGFKQWLQHNQFENAIQCGQTGPLALSSDYLKFLKDRV